MITPRTAISYLLSGAAHPLDYIRPREAQIPPHAKTGKCSTAMFPPKPRFFVHPTDTDLKPLGQLFGCQNVFCFECVRRIHLQRPCNGSLNQWISSVKNVTSGHRNRWSSRPDSPPCTPFGAFPCCPVPPIRGEHGNGTLKAALFRAVPALGTVVTN